MIYLLPVNLIKIQKAGFDRVVLLATSPSAVSACQKAVDHVDVEHVGDESGADPLDRVFAGLQRLAGPVLSEHRAVDRLDGDHADLRQEVLVTAIGIVEFVDQLEQI